MTLPRLIGFRFHTSNMISQLIERVNHFSLNSIHFRNQSKVQDDEDDEEEQAAAPAAPVAAAPAADDADEDGEQEPAVGEVKILSKKEKEKLKKEKEKVRVQLSQRTWSVYQGHDPNKLTFLYFRRRRRPSWQPRRPLPQLRTLPPLLRLLNRPLLLPLQPPPPMERMRTMLLTDPPLGTKRRTRRKRRRPLLRTRRLPRPSLSLAGWPLSRLLWTPRRLWRKRPPGWPRRNGSESCLVCCDALIGDASHH